MSYLFEISALGGIGGSPFDHRDALRQQNVHMGVGEKGVHLENLHIEMWSVLSHVSATYSCWRDPHRIVTAAGVGNIKQPDTAVDVRIAPNERVAIVSGEYGFNHYMAGGVCLTYLQLTLQAVDGTQRIIAAGQRQFPEHMHQQLGNHRHPRNYAGCLQVVPIPEGLTLAGIAGRAGDSWDQLRLFVCPFLPGGGSWSSSVHRHYLHPFRQQVRTFLLCLCRMEHNGSFSQVLPGGVREHLVAALFKVQLLSEHVPATSTAGAEASGGVTGTAAEGATDTAAAEADAAVNSSSGNAAAGIAAASGSGGTLLDAAAAADGSNFLEDWVRQQVNDVDLMLLMTERPNIEDEFDSDEYEYDDPDE